MRLKLYGICLLMLSSFVSAEVTEPKLGKYPQVYQSGNYTVTLLRVGEVEQKNYLVRVEGIDNDFDGEIFLHRTLCDNTTCEKYKLETKQIPGKERWWTIQTTNDWASRTGLILYPPGIEQKQYLSKLERPKEFNPAAFYQAYLTQASRR